MINPKTWFELLEFRRRSIDKAVWIPLRAAHYPISVGRYGLNGHVEEFFGAGTLAVPSEHRAAVERLGWMDIGISRNHRPYVENNRYVPADVYLAHGGTELGVNLVMESSVSGPEPNEWIIHPDLVLGFRLLQEGDRWLSPDDGYEAVIELKRDASGAPAVLAMKAEYLKDYLAARDMALYVTGYRSRREIAESCDFEWKESDAAVVENGRRWEGRVAAIHEGGMPYGGRTAVFHVAHADFDSEQDVPVLPHPLEGKFDSTNWEVGDEGRKLWVAYGELWKNEWVEPGSASPRIRGDRQASTATFIIDASGGRRDGDSLTEEGRWLWFRPDIIAVLAGRRGGYLHWYSRHTGAIECVPSSRVHFGVNRLGFVNVYAKDIGYLPAWQQRLWAGYNVTPEGGVSEELQASQVRGTPPDTQAPEAFIAQGLARLGHVSQERFGTSFVRDHAELDNIIARSHRFRALNQAGLFSLAKDLARLTADAFDEAVLNTELGLKGKDKLGSLKAVERVIARDLGDAKARKLMGPLFGIYDLRLGDAHLPRADLASALELACVNDHVPPVYQGYQLTHACVSVLNDISDAIASAAAHGTQ